MIDAGAMTESMAERRPAVQHAPLELTLIGGIGLRCRGVQLPLPNRKARALLGFLALDGGGFERRERLADLFWGDTGERNARASLRQTLLELRQAFSEAGCAPLRIDREVVALPDARVDAQDMLAEIAGGMFSAVVLGMRNPAAALLAGYDDLAPRFGEWLIGIRQTWQARLRLAIETACDREDVPARDRLRLAEAAFRFDALDESACRMIMRLAAVQGDTAAALRAYADLYKALGEELDMEPAASTQALVADIKLGRFDEQTAPSPSARPPSPVIESTVPIVAILPFRVLGPDQSGGTFADGVVEDIVCALAGLREPVVLSSGSTRGFVGAFDLNRLVGELGARYAVTGTLRRAGPQIRLAVELVDTTSLAVLWAQVFDTREEQLFDAQDRIAACVANTLTPRVHDAELRRSRGRRGDEIDAYHLLLRARDLVFRLERPAFEDAGEMLRRSVALDPGYAGARTALAEWFSLRLGQGWSADRAGDTARLEAAARDAVRLDPFAARALALLGHSRTILARDYGEARQLIGRALSAAPNDAQVWLWSSPTYAFIGEAREAIRRAERAIALSPQDPLLFRHEHFLSIACYAAGDMSAAAAWGLSSVRRNPNYTSALRMAAAALAAIGRVDDARLLTRTVLALEPEFRTAQFAVRLPFADQGVSTAYAEHLTMAGFPA